METIASPNSVYLATHVDLLPVRPPTPHICTGVVTPNSIDSRESDSGLQIVAQLPYQLEREEVNVTFEDGGKELVLNVRKKSKDQEELGKEINQFKVFGEFTKRFDVPYNCDTNAMHVDYEQSGQITVSVPRFPETTSKNARRMSYS